MNWPLALGVAVIIGGPLIAAIRAFRSAPIAEEFEGVGFVTDPEKLRVLRCEQDARRCQSDGLWGLSVGGQVNDFHAEVGK